MTAAAGNESSKEGLPHSRGHRDLALPSAQIVSWGVIPRLKRTASGGLSVSLGRASSCSWEAERSNDPGDFLFTLLPTTSLGRPSEFH